MQKIKEKIKRLQDIYINGIIELNDYESKYKELNDELEKEQDKYIHAVNVDIKI